MLFNIIPTLLEIALVAGILLFYYSAWFALIVVVSVVIYIAATTLLTEWRTRHVRESNRLDAQANTRAVDSLLNFETVKYFGNERYEADRYDRELRGFPELVDPGESAYSRVRSTALEDDIVQGVRDDKNIAGHHLFDHLRGILFGITMHGGTVSRNDPTLHLVGHGLFAQDLEEFR